MDPVARVKASFAPIEADVLGVLLFGSHAEGRAHGGSDLDVCVVGGPGARPDEVLRLVWQEARDLHGVDVKVFEELPLFLQGDILDHHVVALTKDAPALGEYLRERRKVWQDQALHRHRTPEDVRRMLDARVARVDGVS